MKKILIVLLTLAVMIMSAGCAAGDKNETTLPEESTVQAEQNTTSAAASATKSVWNNDVLKEFSLEGLKMPDGGILDEFEYSSGDVALSFTVSGVTKAQFEQLAQDIISLSGGTPDEATEEDYYEIANGSYIFMVAYTTPSDSAEVGAVSLLCISA